MALDERYQWVIDKDAGVADAMGRVRIVAVGLDKGRVILAIGADGGDPEVDTRAWVTMPDEVADKLGYHLLSAAEKLRQQRRRS